jgi:hypothetical protein
VHREILTILSSNKAALNISSRNCLHPVPVGDAVHLNLLLLCCMIPIAVHCSCQPVQLLLSGDPMQMDQVGWLGGFWVTTLVLCGLYSLRNLPASQGARWLIFSSHYRADHFPECMLC